METLLLKAGLQQDIARAGELLRKGGLVVIPTETVYGLAANALDARAVSRIYEAKGRPSDNPLIVHVSTFSELAPLVQEVPPAAERLATAFWPGPLTIILPKSTLVPDKTSGTLDTVAVRCPADETARAVIRAAGVPLAAPSANLSGRPSPTTFAHVREDMEGRVEAIIDGGDCAVGVESTVVTLAQGTPRILRPGAVTLEQLRAVLGEVAVDPAVMHRLETGAAASSPGMKYKHYAPTAQVVLVDASPDIYVRYVNKQEGATALCFEETAGRLRVPTVSYGSRYDRASQAQRLFSALHALDGPEEESGALVASARRVYAQMPSKAGLGLAVYNRMIRAAGFAVLCPESMVVLGLTGQSGAGKSYVASLLSSLSCQIIDCDAVTKAPGVYDADCIRALQEAFGPDVAERGVLNRRLLAERAFSSPERTRQLNEITHPRILSQLQNRLREARESGALVTVLDAPTLFESGVDSACDRIVAVTAPKQQRLQRVMERDGLTQAAVLERFSAQKEEAFYTEKADYVVSGSGERLTRQLSALLEEIKGERKPFL